MSKTTYLYIRQTNAETPGPPTTPRPKVKSGGARTAAGPGIDRPPSLLDALYCSTPVQEWSTVISMSVRLSVFLYANISQKPHISKFHRIFYACCLRPYGSLGPALAALQLCYVSTSGFVNNVICSYTMGCRRRCK